MKKAATVLVLLLLLLVPLRAEAQATENVFLITLDGLRWQELFGGADSLLLYDERYTGDPEALAARFWAADARTRREKLMPFSGRSSRARGSSTATAGPAARPA